MLDDAQERWNLVEEHNKSFRCDMDRIKAEDIRLKNLNLELNDRLGEVEQREKINQLERKDLEAFKTNLEKFSNNLKTQTKEEKNGPKEIT